MVERRFPPPWTVETIPGGFKVIDANGQSLAYVYSRETKDAADIAKVLPEDEARRIASNIPSCRPYSVKLAKTDLPLGEEISSRIHEATPLSLSASSVRQSRSSCVKTTVWFGKPGEISSATRREAAQAPPW
jgi:hypothetical protein